MQQNTTEIFRDAPVPKAVLSNVIPSIISMFMVLIFLNHIQTVHFVFGQITGI